MSVGYWEHQVLEVKERLDADKNKASSVDQSSEITAGTESFL